MPEVVHEDELAGRCRRRTAGSGPPRPPSPRSSIHFTPEPDEEERHDEHEERPRTSGPWSSCPRRSTTPFSFRKSVREVVVERERDADEERAEHEDREGAVLHERRARRGPGRRAPSPCGRGTSAGCGAGRRQKTPSASADAAAATRSGPAWRLDAHGAPRSEAGHDPADGAEDADRGELLLRARHLVEGDRVHEGEGRDCSTGRRRGAPRRTPPAWVTVETR